MLSLSLSPTIPTRSLQAKRIFFLGPSRSGTFFHAHSHTFNVLAHGAKHWLLLPPGAPYGAQGRTAAAWLERLKRGGDTADEVAPADSPPALRCTQRAGQVRPGRCRCTTHALDTYLTLQEHSSLLLNVHTCCHTERTIAQLPPSYPAYSCLQVLFVPSGWNHATTNLGWAVGVAAEVGDVAMMEAASRM